MAPKMTMVVADQIVTYRAVDTVVAKAEMPIDMAVEPRVTC